MASLYLSAALGLLLVAGCSLAESIKCEMNRNRVMARSGDTTSLPCHFSTSGQSEQLLKVAWQTKVGLVVHAENSTMVWTESQDEAFKSRTSMFPSWHRTGNATLQITQVRPSDSGSYTCYIRTDQRPTICAQLDLTVNAAGAVRCCGDLSAWIMTLLLPLAKLLT
ncbi:CD276 antigen-like [Heptranchias perlo]|uniref:CD276 antigen-like n=1 Tax=Heptranchias perlo TaxID=212740 RepID=UPI00355940BC